MEPSIFYTVKRMLGVANENKAFDEQILVAINSALMVANQIGVGPETGFRVEGITETWDDFLGEHKDVDGVQAFIYLRCRLMFDPPSNSFLVNAIENQIKELEWRVMEQVEERRRRVGPGDYTFGGFDLDTPWSQGTEVGDNPDPGTARA